MEEYIDTYDELLPAEEPQYDSYGNGSLTSVQETLASMNLLAQNGTAIVDSICNARVSLKQMDVQMHEMDVQLNAFTAQLSSDLEKYKERSDMVRSTVENYNRCISRMLDTIIAMDAQTAEDFERKMRMMEQVDGMMSRLTDTMTKFL